MAIRRIVVRLKKRPASLADIAAETLGKLPLNRGHGREKPTIARVIIEGDLAIPGSDHQRRALEARQPVGGVSFDDIAEATLAHLPEVGGKS